MTGNDFGRAGAFGLSILASPINCLTLNALQERPTALLELRAAVGWPPDTTLRNNLRLLDEVGILSRGRKHEFPTAGQYTLRDSGEHLLPVLRDLEGWLREAPAGPIPIGSTAATAAVKALIGGWTTSVIRALMAKSLTLTQLSQLIVAVSYPSLERRLSALRLCGQIRPCPGAGKGTSYAVTGWLREAARPLASSIGWEQRWTQPGATTPLKRSDFETLLLLMLPVLALPGGPTGSCELVVNRRKSGGDVVVSSMLAEIHDGAVDATVLDHESHAGAIVSGSAAQWLRILGDGEAGGMTLGGDARLAQSFVSAVEAFGVSRAEFTTRSPAIT